MSFKHIQDHPLKPSPTVKPAKMQSHYLSPSVIELRISEPVTDLLHLFNSLTTEPTNRDESLDVRIQRLIQLIWLITVHAFTSSSIMCLGERFSDGECFVGETVTAVVGSAVQIHVDTHESTRDLLQHMTCNLNHEDNKLQSNEGLLQKQQDSRFNTRIIYQRQSASPVNGTHACIDGCKVGCPIPEMTPIDRDFLPNCLHLHIRHTSEDCLYARLDVGTSNVDLPLATSLLHTFNKAMSSLVILPGQRIRDVEMCSRHDLGWITNFTRRITPAQEALLHDLCLRHVQTTPDALAVRSWDGDLTYRELHNLTTSLAHWLVGQGVKPGVFVACAFYKSTWAIVARLAILMAGGAYICVDAHDPPPYLASVLDRTKVKIMLSSVGFAQKFTNRVDIQFEVGEASIRALPYHTTVPCSTVKPDDPCVVLFTSGSTGNPKGIIQEHRSYATALTDYIRVTGMGPHSHLFQFDAYAFDISNNDLLAPLIAGGCCCVPTTSLTMEALMVDLNNLQANMMFVTPSAAVDIDPERVPMLQVMCIGGEPVSDAVLAKWLPRVQVVNQYGMGEVASLCAYNVNLQMGRGAVVGRPASGAIWIVNPDSPDQLMPVGAVGELLIEGPHVARGYLDHVSGKSENFLNAPPPWLSQLHPNRPLHRFYRSGDLGRYNHDGTIELIGRKDTMLKLDGARVEAGQVEYVLSQHLSSGDAAVVDILGEVDGISDPILCAYLYLASNPMNAISGPVEEMQFWPIVKHHAVSSLSESLRDTVRSNLPHYYIPSLFLLIDRVPRTKSKKTDRRELHMLGQTYYMAHREELNEIVIWPTWD